MPRKRSDATPPEPTQATVSAALAIGPAPELARGHGAKFEQAMPLAVAALVEGRTVEEAAAAAGVSVPTVFRWGRLASFQDRLSAGRRQALENTVTKLLALSPKVVATLEALLDDADPKVRTKAVEIALAQSWKGLEMTDMANQIERLKGRLKEAKHGRKRGVKVLDQAACDAARPLDPAGRGEPAEAGGRPGGDAGPRWADAGPLAGDVAPLFGEADPGGGE